MTPRGLNRIVQVWSRRLPTRGHAVTARFAKTGELEKDCFGVIDWDDQLMTADIRMRPGMSREETVKTVIHEILHLTVGRGRERAVNLVAEAFYRAFQRRRK